MKVLIVDDDWHICKLFTFFLKDYETSFVCKGKDVIDAVEQFKPHAILLDLMLPDVDGYKILQKLRSKEKYKNLVILVVTAKPFKSIDFVNQADEVLAKPLSRFTLLNKLKSLGIIPG